MSLSASTVWEQRTTGNDLNGGGYAGGGTDYSQQAAAELSVSDGAGAGTTNLSSATGGFTAAMIGNLAQISSGTLTPGFYQIAAYVDANNVTLDRALNTGSGSTVKIGGALATFAKYEGAIVAGNTVFVKAGTYTHTAFASIAFTGAASLPIRFVGYDTNRDILCIDTSRPLVTTSTNSAFLFRGNNTNNVTFRNFDFTNTATTKVSMFTSVTAASTFEFYYCMFDGFTSINVNSPSAGLQINVDLFYCECRNFTNFVVIRGNTGSLRAQYCYFHDNYGAFGWTNTGGIIRASNCIFANHTSNAINFSRTTTSNPELQLSFCTFYQNTGAAIWYQGNAAVAAEPLYLHSNIFWGGDYGVRFTNSQVFRTTLYENNAFGGQAVAARSNIAAGENEIILTANPFTSAATGDFSLNNTAGGGADVRGLGTPQSFPGSITFSFSDLGTAQHQDAGGGGSTERSHTFIG